MRKCLLLLPLLLAGCARLFPNSYPASNSEQAFQTLADDYIAGYLAWRPQVGTALGLHEYDGQITDFSQGSIETEHQRLKTFDARLAALNAAQLSPRSSFDYRLLRSAIKRELFSFEEMQSYSRNPMTYAGALDVNIYIKRDFAPLADRVASLTAILNQAPGIFAAAKANLAPVLPRPMVQTAIEQAEGSADFLEKDLVAAVRSVKDPAVLGAFDIADRRAIYALRDFAAYLKQQKLPKADDSYALGRTNYMKLLEYGEMLTQSPEELLDFGMRELKKKQQVFAEAAREIDPTRPAPEVFAEIQKEHPTELSLIPDVARHLEMIRQFVISHNLVTLPSQVRARVAETPEYLRATSFASMDTPGPFETRATEAYYYVTPPEADWTPEQKEQWLMAFNYYTTDIVSIHEAYPGHYVQFLCMNASAANRLEKIFSSYAFVEGWAHYCEQMMVDEGFGAGSATFPETQDQGPKYRLAQTDEALLRVCRLCVSIKMHCQGMTVDEAARFFQDNCYYGAKPAHEEAMRGAFDPEYLYYTIGKLEILKLRDDYQRQQGPAFSLRDFHDELLRHGCPPIRLLREMMLHDSTIWDEVL